MKQHLNHYHLPKSYLARLWLLAWLVNLLVQVPGMGNVDSARRLQVTRSMWTSAPPVREVDYPGFGAPGRNGDIHAWYGVGQSLLMLPADILAAGVEKFTEIPETRLKIRSGVVATLTFPALNATTVVLVFLWIGQLGFRVRESLSGAMSLLLGSSFLHYCQIHMENSLQNFLMFADAVFLWQWMISNRRRWLAAAAATVAFALLVRLPSLGEHFGIWLAVLWLIARRRPERLLKSGFSRFRLPQLLLVALPMVLVGVLADRAYHFHRFGNWTGTYIGEFAAECRRQQPDTPVGYPFSGNFWEGFLGPFFSPDRSVILLDPLLWLLIGACVMQWPRIASEVKIVLAGGVIGCLLLVVFYAKCDFWHGASSWGNRYTLPAFHLLVPLAVPLWWTTLRAAGRWARLTLVAVVSLSVLMQVLSLLLPDSVDGAYQVSTGKTGLVPALRLKNVAAKLAGKPAPPGVTKTMWRINLAPVTLGQGSAGRLVMLWCIWLVGGCICVVLMRSLWQAGRLEPCRCGAKVVGPNAALKTDTTR